MHDSKTQRTRLLVQLERGLERPMIVLSALWLILVTVELARGESPAITAIANAIWAIFVADFALKLAVATERGHFLRRNWATALSLLLPAFRLLRLARVVRAARLVRVGRGLRAAKLLGGLNRGMRTLRRVVRRRGLGYAAGLTAIVLLVGAAGMMAFERGGAEPGPFDSYGAALWWTAMLLTSIGSEHWPATAAGRWFSLALAVYGFAVFGYLTATLASFFVDKDAADRRRLAALDGVRRELTELRREVRALRKADAPSPLPEP